MLAARVYVRPRARAHPMAQAAGAPTTGLYWATQALLLAALTAAMWLWLRRRLQRRQRPAQVPSAALQGEEPPAESQPDEPGKALVDANAAWSLLDPSSQSSMGSIVAKDSSHRGLAGAPDAATAAPVPPAQPAGTAAVRRSHEPPLPPPNAPPKPQHAAALGKQVTNVKAQPSFRTLQTGGTFGPGGAGPPSSCSSITMSSLDHARTSLLHAGTSSGLSSFPTFATTDGAHPPPHSFLATHSSLRPATSTAATAAHAAGQRAAPQQGAAHTPAHGGDSTSRRATALPALASGPGSAASHTPRDGSLDRPSAVAGLLHGIPLEDAVAAAVATLQAHNGAAGADAGSRAPLEEEQLQMQREADGGGARDDDVQDVRRGARRAGDGLAAGLGAIGLDEGAEEPSPEGLQHGLRRAARGLQSDASAALGAAPPGAHRSMEDVAAAAAALRRRPSAAAPPAVRGRGAGHYVSPLGPRKQVSAKEARIVQRGVQPQLRCEAPPCRRLPSSRAVVAPLPQVSIKIATRHQVADLPPDTMERLQRTLDRVSAQLTCVGETRLQRQPGLFARLHSRTVQYSAAATRRRRRSLTAVWWATRCNMRRASSSPGSPAGDRPQSAPSELAARSHHRGPLITSMAVRSGCVRIVLETARPPARRPRGAGAAGAPRAARNRAGAAPAGQGGPCEGEVLGGGPGGAGDLQLDREEEEEDAWANEGDVEEEEDGDEEGDGAAADSRTLQLLALRVVEALGLDAACLAHMDHVDVQVKRRFVRNERATHSVRASRLQQSPSFPHSCLKSRARRARESTLAKLAAGRASSSVPHTSKPGAHEFDRVRRAGGRAAGARHVAGRPRAVVGQRRAPARHARPARLQAACPLRRPRALAARPVRRPRRQRRAGGGVRGAAPAGRRRGGLHAGRERPRGDVAHGGAPD